MMNERIYDVIESHGPGKTIFDEVILSTYDKVYAINTAHELNMYFAQYTEDCPVYQVSIRNVLKYPIDLALPKLDYVNFTFDEDCNNVNPMRMSYSNLSSVKDAINNCQSNIAFRIFNEEYMSFTTTGTLKVNIGEALKDKNVKPYDANRSLLLLTRYAKTMVKDIGKTIHDTYGMSLTDIVDETDWCDLNDVFKSILIDVDDFTKVINIDSLYHSTDHQQNAINVPNI